jgi:hypothetical protein
MMPLAVALACWFVLLAAPAAFPVHGSQTVLPVGTELNEDALAKPREVLRSEALGGRKSYLVNLGDIAFSSPAILGGVARQTGISCSTCHVNGASNPKFYIPGLSTRPGNFITANALFNAAANNRLLDPVTIPSLCGARYLAPYGHDGRIASLRDFIHNVIVNEFAGPEPSPAILDAMVIYIQDIDFLANPLLAPGGRLRAQASDAARRGEVLLPSRSRMIPVSAAPDAMYHPPPLSIISSTMSAPADCTRRRHCSMPTSMRPIFTTGAMLVTTRWWRISIAFSSWV